MDDTPATVQLHGHLISHDHPLLSEVRNAFDRLRRPRFPRFIGNHPRDLDRATLKRLSLEDFVYTEKKDGLRVLAVFLQSNSSNEARLVFNDRKNDFLVLERLMDSQEFSLVEKQDVISTRSPQYLIDIFDCELCLDESDMGIFNDTAFSLSMLGELSTSDLSRIMSNCTLHGFDLLMRNSERYTNLPFAQRHEHLLEYCSQLQSFVNSFSSRFVVKGISKIEALFDDEQIRLASNWEGMVLYDLRKPYFSKDEDFLLRWKPARTLSVDLLVQKELRVSILLAWAGREQFVEVGRLSTEMLDLADGQRTFIAEFTLQMDDRIGWTFVRWRPDRMKPNHISRVRLTMDEAKHGMRDIYEFLREIS